MFMRSGFVLRSAGVCALALIVVGAATTTSKESEGADAVPSVVAQASPTPAGDRVHRNLALHATAFNFSRKTGRRYGDSRGRSLMTVVLNVGGQSQSAQVVRSQTREGERIHISLADGRTLTWSREEGPSVAGARGTGGSTPGSIAIHETTEAYEGITNPKALAAPNPYRDSHAAAIGYENAHRARKGLGGACRRECRTFRQ